MERVQFECSICYTQNIQNAVMCKQCQKPTCGQCRQKTLESLPLCPHCKTNTEFIMVKYGEELQNKHLFTQKCPLHNSFNFNSFCVTCDKFICEQCKKDHNNHTLELSVRKKYYEIQNEILKYKKDLFEFIAKLKEEKEQKQKYVEQKQKTIGEEVDKLMLEQKKHLKNTLESIKEAEIFNIKSKLMFLSTLKTEVQELIEKNQNETCLSKIAEIYVNTKATQAKYNEIVSTEAKVEEQSTDSINNSNIFPPYYMRQLVFDYSPKDNKSTGRTSFQLYNCVWYFKLNKSSDSNNLDFIYKVKGFRKETQFLIIAEILSIDKKNSNIVSMMSPTLTNDICSGFSEILKEPQYSFYCKDNKITVNFYIKYQNYYDIIQDALATPK